MCPDWFALYELVLALFDEKFYELLKLAVPEAAMMPVGYEF